MASALEGLVNRILLRFHSHHYTVALKRAICVVDWDSPKRTVLNSDRRSDRISMKNC